MSGVRGGYYYGFPGRLEAKAFDAVITSIVLVCYHPISVLFDPGLTYFYVSTYFSLGFDLSYDIIFVSVHFSTPVGEPLIVDRVY